MNASLSPFQSEMLDLLGQIKNTEDMKSIRDIISDYAAKNTESEDNGVINQISMNEVILILKPQRCAYSTYEFPDFIEIPQNENELQSLIDSIGEQSFMRISKEKAVQLGYKELAAWSNDNDFIFLLEDESLVLCLAKSLFK